MNYTELQVTTNFSFLRGASHPEELVEQAAELGLHRNCHNRSQYACRYCAGTCSSKKTGIRIIVGCRLICWMA